MHALRQLMMLWTDPSGLYHDLSNSTGMLYSTAFWVKFLWQVSSPTKKVRIYKTHPRFIDLKYSQPQEPRKTYFPFSYQHILVARLYLIPACSHDGVSQSKWISKHPEGRCNWQNCWTLQGYSWKPPKIKTALYPPESTDRISADITAPARFVHKEKGGCAFRQSVGT